MQTEIHFFMNKTRLFTMAGLLIAVSLAICGQSHCETSPDVVGRKLTARFVATAHPNFNGNPAPPNEITYPETCAWLGALRFAEAIGDSAMIDSLEARLLPIFGAERRLQPLPDHVDHSVFGTVPLRLYAISGNPIYGSMGLWYADAQWQMPWGSDKEEYRRLLDEGLSWQTRYWIDDMFMISALQCEAYNATGDRRYIDRAAAQMVRYLDKIQQDNGLFYHSSEAPFFWARGNGWMASGMTELLTVLPEDNRDREAILAAYRKMMETLLQYQKADGLWGQLIDDPQAWSETSGSAMFTYALVSGVKNGWLKGRKYSEAASAAWSALVAQLDENGDLAGVCEGTNTSSEREFYLNRKTLKGNMHGQAPMLWCAKAMLK